MKTMLQMDLDRSLTKVNHLKQNVKEMEEKIKNLQENLENIQQSLEKEYRYIESLGLKQPSRDPAKPDTVERKQQKDDYNQNLQKEKAEYIQPQLGDDNPLSKFLNELKTRNGTL